MADNAEAYAALIRELNAATNPLGSDAPPAPPDVNVSATGVRATSDLGDRASARVPAAASSVGESSPLRFAAPLENEDKHELPPPAAAEAPDPTIYASEFLDEILDISPDVPPVYREKALELFKRRVLAFGFDGRLGHLDANAKVRTKDDVNPISEPMHGASPEKRQVIEEQLKKWFELGVIEPSESPWAAPVVIVYRNGKPRF
ncbi:hypothetical protein EXIGLDRAFT_607621, partial [Exidia glandulosa HHB12029]